jgi:hypothetical protein
VVVKVDCATDEARLEANFRVRQSRGVVDSPAGEKRPWMRTMGVGPARIEVDFQSFTADAIDDEMSPPTYEWEVDR